MSKGQAQVLGSEGGINRAAPITASAAGVSGRTERRWQLVFFGTVCLVLVLLLVLPFIDLPTHNDHYVYLARSFVAGNLTVDNLPDVYRDFILFEGHKYLPFGSFPAVVLVPALPLIDAGVHMVWIGYALTLLNVWLLYLVLSRAGVMDDRRGWAMLLFFAGTSYFGVFLVGISTYFAHVVTTTCILLAVAEMLGRRRLVLVGLFIGLAAATRFTSLFMLPFFLWLLWRERSGASQGSGPQTLAIRLGALGAGLIGPLALLALYNYARFGSPTETGFGLAALYHPYLSEARSAGLFSPIHIPKNLFMMLLQGPTPYPSADAPVLQFPYIQPSTWGMGIFFTSPALLFAFRAKLREPLVQACWLAIIFTALPIINYYGIGFVQFGYRYALDFMPFLLVLAALGMPPAMSNRARALVLLSVGITLWGSMFLALWL